MGYLKERPDDWTAVRDLVDATIDQTAAEDVASLLAFCQPPEAWPAFATSFLDGALPTVSLHDTPALALRFLADDLKALYGEAVQADGTPPSARQIDTWFWRRTIAGQLLIALRSAASQSDNNALKTVGGRFFVPSAEVPHPPAMWRLPPGHSSGRGSGAF